MADVMKGEKIRNKKLNTEFKSLRLAIQYPRIVKEKSIALFKKKKIENKEL